MKLLFLISFIFINLLKGNTQQILLEHNYNSSLIYITNVNIREKASLNSRIIGEGKKDKILAFSSYAKKDTINGIENVWVKVKINDKWGYAWGELIGKASTFKSTEYLDDNFMISLDNKNMIKVQLFNDEVLKKVFLLPNKTRLKFYAGFSIGKTYNSNENDIFAFYFGDYDSTITKLYQWNGKTLTPFNKKINDKSYSSYNRTNNQLITEKLVNFRTKPSVDANIIKVLDLGYKVEVINKKFKPDYIKNEDGYWAKVIYNNDTGYVWANFLSFYSFESYKEKDLTFIIKKEKGYGASKILAVKNNVLIDSLSFNISSSFIGAYSKGNMGLKNISEIIGVCYSGGACGKASGDLLISWNGEKFNTFFDEYGVGDGNLSYGYNLTFPSDLNGKNNIISITNHESESIDLYSKKGEHNYESINRSYLTRNYVYKHDSLNEIYSETNRFEKLLTDKFPKYQLNYFEEGDINNDGYKDAIIYSTFKQESNNYEYYEKHKNKSLFVILLNDKKGGYYVQSSSKKLIIHKSNDPLTKVILQKNGFTINVYYSGYYNNEQNQKQYEIQYKFNKQKNAFLMKKITENIPPQNYDGEWEQEVYYYKSNNILFKDSYHLFWE